MTKILSITVNRSDFSRMSLLYNALHNDPDFELTLVAYGAHFDEAFGHSIDIVRQSPFNCIELAPKASNPCQQSAEFLSGISNILAQNDYDLMLILGDRYEMLSPAIAAIHHQIPIAHIGGGYITTGAIDDSIRHAISKMSHIHFVANQSCAQRLIRMGESPKTVHITGAPDIDILKGIELIDREDLNQCTGLVDGPFILSTIHPETTGEFSEGQARQAFEALKESGLQVLITAPAPDKGHDVIFKLIDEYKTEIDGFHYEAHLGAQNYLSAMNYAALVFGNSSSGIIEANHFKVPVVNIGNRQQGRRTSTNIINCDWQKSELLSAIEQCQSPAFIDNAKQAETLFGDGKCTEKVIKELKKFQSGVSLAKVFYED